MAELKGQTWRYEETKALIDIWGDISYQNKLKGSVKNLPVFKEISEELEEKHGVIAFFPPNSSK